jgi:hypothetical protein
MSDQTLLELAQSLGVVPREWSIEVAPTNTNPNDPGPQP